MGDELFTRQEKRILDAFAFCSCGKRKEWFESHCWDCRRQEATR